MFFKSLYISRRIFSISFLLSKKELFRIFSKIKSTTLPDLTKQRRYAIIGKLKKGVERYEIYFRRSGKTVKKTDGGEKRHT